MPPYASEFTPDMDAGFLASILKPIDDEEAANEGRAKTEAFAGGLEGQASLGSKVGAARQGAADTKARTIGQFNLGVADRQRQERLTEQENLYRSDEAQKSRDFQEKMTEMGYLQQSGERNASQRFGSNMFNRGALLGTVGKLAATGVGAYFGGPPGAAAADSLMDKLTAPGEGVRLNPNQQKDDWYINPEEDPNLTGGDMGGMGVLR